MSGTCDAESGECGGSMTSGLVGDMTLRVLPNVTPLVTLLLTCLSLLVSIPTGIYSEPWDLLGPAIL